MSGFDPPPSPPMPKPFRRQPGPPDRRLFKLGDSVRLRMCDGRWRVGRVIIPHRPWPCNRDREWKLRAKVKVLWLYTEDAKSVYPVIQQSEWIAEAALQHYDAVTALGRLL